MKITKKDLVQLSTYLDGELNRSEIIRLEKRMKLDPDLKDALDELKKTKQILSTTPRIRVPRNFTLSTDQVGIRTRKPVYRQYSLAAAVMSFAFIGILVFDIGSSFLRGGFGPAMAPMAEEIMMDAAAESASDTMEEPELMAADPEAEMDRAVEESEQDPDENLSEPAAEVGEGTTAEAEVFEESAPAVGAESPEEAKTTSGEEPEDGVTSAEQNNEQNQEDQPQPTTAIELLPQQTQTMTYADKPNKWEVQLKTISPLRVLEIIFGLGIIGFGVAAWVLKRKDSR